MLANLGGLVVILLLDLCAYGVLYLLFIVACCFGSGLVGCLLTIF